MQARLQGPGPARADQLVRGSSRPAGESEPWATFMRPIPCRAPPLKPAGLAALLPDALRRWRADAYRYAPCQCKLGNMVVREGGRSATPTSRGRRVRLGFPWRCCRAGLGIRRELSAEAAEDLQCSQCGSSFSVPVVAALIGIVLYREGAPPRPPSVGECWGATTREGKECIGELTGRDIGDIAPTDARALGRAALVRAAAYQGSDVRLAPGVIQNPLTWPRRGAEAGRWQWRVCVGLPQRIVERMNALELRASRLLPVAVRSAGGSYGRVAHLCDSQVRVAVAGKGWSSSLLLRRLLARLNASLLATSCRPFFVYVRSDQAPADSPGRWR